MAEVRISVTARDQLEDLPADVRDRIEEKLLEEVAPNPERHLKRLSNAEEYRVRIGDYRAIVEWDKSRDVLRIHEVGHRRNVYD